jgi:hypothetical protein
LRFNSFSRIRLFFLDIQSLVVFPFYLIGTSIGSTISHPERFCLFAYEMGNPLRRKENNTRWSSISIPLPIDTNDPRASKMDSHFPIEISDSEVEIELGTATAPVVVDESEDEAEQEEQVSFFTIAAGIIRMLICDIGCGDDR